jgi:hypothetical protein
MPTVTIPDNLAERFREEAAKALDIAGERLDEAVRYRKGEDVNVDFELVYTEGAARLVESDGLEVEVNHATTTAVEDCALPLVEEIHAVIGRQDPDRYAEAERATHDLLQCLRLLRQLGRTDG